MRPTKRDRDFNAARYRRSNEARMVAGFFILLYLVGGGLIWFFYGRYGAILGLACITGGLLFFLLLYGILSLLGRWAGE